MKKSDVGLNFKSAINGFSKEDVNLYINNMKMDFDRLMDEREDELMVIKGLNAKLSETHEASLTEKENQIKYLNIKSAGLTTQLESLEKNYQEEYEKFEVIRMNLEKELHEKSGMSRVEIEQIKNEMVSEIEQLQREITQNRKELAHMDELYKIVQQEKADLEHENYRVKAEFDTLSRTPQMSQEDSRLLEEMIEKYEKMIESAEKSLDDLKDENLILREECRNLSTKLMEVSTARQVTDEETTSSRIHDATELEREKNELQIHKDALVNVLVMAQKQADEIVSAAQINAQTLIETARKEQILLEERAKSILEEAKLRASEEMMRAEAAVRIEHEKLYAIRREIKEVREGIIRKLNTYKEGIDQLMVLESDKDKTVIPMREHHG